jgi:hypothetical protein
MVSPASVPKVRKKRQRPVWGIGGIERQNGGKLDSLPLKSRQRPLSKRRQGRSSRYDRFARVLHGRADGAQAPANSSSPVRKSLWLRAATLMPVAYQPSTFPADPEGKSSG